MNLLVTGAAGFIGSNMVQYLLKNTDHVIYGIDNFRAGERNKEFLDISKFYMTAKFFDARLGVFVKMTNTPQSDIASKFMFDPEIYFYYEVRLNYNEKTYEVWDNSVRRGTSVPIKWYEYINP